MSAGKPGLDLPETFERLDYRQRRFTNWMFVGLLYSFFYMTRYQLAALAPTLREVFGWSKDDFVSFETVLPLIYGLSVVINAPIADRIGGRKAFLFGAAGVVVMNVIFGLSYLLVLAPGHYVWDVTPHELAWILAIPWALNGYFQSFGALSIVKINAQWFHLKERGTFGAIFGVLIRFGLILAFSGAPLIANWLPWQYAFFIPAGFVALLFVCNLLWVKESPAEAGFGELDTGDAVHGDDPNPGVFFILRKIFTSRTMWMIALASMMIGFVRRSVVDAWWPLYYSDVLHVAKADLGYQLTAWGIAIFGILGGFAFGMTSDRVFTGRRAPVVTIGFLGMAAALGLFWLSGALGLGLLGNTAAILLLSFFVNGAHGIIGGAASMDFGGRKGAATAAGLFDGMQYLAGSVTGKAVTMISKEYGWEMWKLWPVPFALFGAVVMSRLWNARPGRGGH